MKWIVSLLLFVTVAQAADIGLSPPRLELIVEPGETVTETVMILSDAVQEQQLQVNVEDFTLDPKGDLSALPSASLEHSASAWLQPELSEFVVAGANAREFRVSVSVPEDASLAGTYHGMVFLLSCHRLQKLRVLVW
jgi:hypothetical protein